MKNAQVDVRQPAKAITGWASSGLPVYTEIPEGACIVDVQDVTYPVGVPLYWVECADNVEPWIWYYDQVSQTCILVPPPAPKPAAADQPVVDGAQPL